MSNKLNVPQAAWLPCQLHLVLSETIKKAKIKKKVCTEFYSKTSGKANNEFFPYLVVVVVEGHFSDFTTRNE